MSSQDLVERWIVPDAVRSGPEEARVKGYGVHVWVILDLLKKYQVGKQSAARAYDLPLEAIDAALLYYETYKRDFDAKLALVASDDPMPRSAISVRTGEPAFIRGGRLSIDPRHSDLLRVVHL